MRVGFPVNGVEKVVDLLRKTPATNGAPQANCGLRKIQHEATIRAWFGFVVAIFQGVVNLLMAIEAALRFAMNVHKTIYDFGGIMTLDRELDDIISLLRRWQRGIVQLTQTELEKAVVRLRYIAKTRQISIQVIEDVIQAPYR